MLYIYREMSQNKKTKHLPHPNRNSFVDCIALEIYETVSLRGRRSNGKGNRLRAQDRAREEGGGERQQGSHCFCHPAY